MTDELVNGGQRKELAGTAEAVPGLGRRGFLTGFSLLSLSTLAGCTTADVARTKDVPAQPDSSGGMLAVDQRLPAADRVSAENPGGTGRYQTPYTVSADCSLSEDHFLIKPGRFDATKDKVVTYVHDDDGGLEAMIVQGGVLSQLYHDPSRNGAWALEPVRVGASDVVDVIDVVAGRPLDAGDRVGALHVFCRTATTVLHLVQAADRSWTSTDLGWPARRGSLPLQIAEDPNGGVFVYWIAQHTGTYIGVDVHFCLVDRDARGETTRTGTATVGTISQSLSAVARLSRSSGKLQLWVFADVDYINYVFVVDLDQNLNQVGTRSFQVNAAPLGSVAKFQAVFAMDETKPPYAIAEGKLGKFWTLIYDPDTTQPTKPWRWTPIWDMPRNLAQDRAFAGIRSLPRGENNDLAARADKVLDVYAILGTSLWVVRQHPSGDAADDSTDPVFGPAVALQGRVAAASLPSSRGDGTGMMFIDTDGELHTLTQDPTSGAWTGNTVHLPAAEALELSTYRVQLSVADAWGQPVIGATVQVSTVGPTIAMINGQPASLTPTSTVPATSDILGRVTVAVPATGLAAPALTVTGDNLARPVTVYPSRRVNDYLTGTTSLNHLPPLTPDVLSAAPIRASKLTDAKACVDVISNAAKAGIPAAQRVGAQRKIRSRHTGTPVLHTSEPLRVGNLEFSLGDFANEVWNGIKTGAAEVSYAVANAASTVAHWAVDITVTCGDFINHVLTIAITDLKSAADVVHSVVNWIGSTVENFLDWLKAQILSVLHDTVSLAAQYETWIKTAASSYLPPLITAGKRNATTWLNAQEATMSNALDATATKLAGKSLADLGTPPQQLSSHRRALTAGSNPLVPDVRSAHANWLLDKILGDFGGMGTVAPIAGTDTLLDDLNGNLATIAHDFQIAAQDLWETLVTALRNPRDIATTGVALLIDALKKLLGAAISFAIAVVDVLADAVLLILGAFGRLLDTSLESLPLLGSLLKAAGSGSPTVGKLATLIIAFPTVLAYKIAHGPDAAPFKTSLNATRRHQAKLGDEIADDLAFTAAGALGFQAFADAIAATLTLLPDEEFPDPAAKNSVTLWGVFDSVAPLIVGTLTMPTDEHALPFTGPLSNDVAEVVSWLCGIGPGILAASLMTYPPGPKRTSFEENSQVLTAQLGAIAITCGVVAGVNDELDHEPWSIAKWGALFLCNLPLVGAIALTEEAKDGSGDLSVGVQVANCLICGGLGAVATAYAE
jgi:hypothetical protein